MRSQQMRYVRRVTVCLMSWIVACSVLPADASDFSCEIRTDRPANAYIVGRPIQMAVYADSPRVELCYSVTDHEGVRWEMRKLWVSATAPALLELHHALPTGVYTVALDKAGQRVAEEVICVVPDPDEGIGDGRVFGVNHKPTTDEEWDALTIMGGRVLGQKLAPAVDARDGKPQGMSLPLVAAREVWSEADQNSYYGDWNRYLDMLRVAYCTLKSHDPRVPIVYGSCGHGTEAAYTVQSRCEDYFDLAAHHPGGTDPGQSLTHWYINMPQVFIKPGKPRESAFTECYYHPTDPAREAGFQLRLFATFKSRHEKFFIRSGCMGGVIGRPDQDFEALLWRQGDKLIPRQPLVAWSVARWLLEDAFYVGPLDGPEGALDSAADAVKTSPASTPKQLHAAQRLAGEGMVRAAQRCQETNIFSPLARNVIWRLVQYTEELGLIADGVGQRWEHMNNVSDADIAKVVRQSNELRARVRSNRRGAECAFAERLQDRAAEQLDSVRLSNGHNRGAWWSALTQVRAAHASASVEPPILRRVFAVADFPTSDAVTKGTLIPPSADNRVAVRVYNFLNEPVSGSLQVLVPDEWSSAKSDTRFLAPAGGCSQSIPVELEVPTNPKPWVTRMALRPCGDLEVKLPEPLPTNTDLWLCGRVDNGPRLPDMKYRLCVGQYSAVGEEAHLASR